MCTALYCVCLMSVCACVSTIVVPRESCITVVEFVFGIASTKIPQPQPQSSVSNIKDCSGRASFAVAPFTMKAAGTTVESVRTAPLHESFSLDARSSGSRGLRNAKFEFMDGTLRSDSTTHWDVHPNSTVGVVHVGHERHREKEHSLSASRVASAGDLMMENTLFVASFKPRVERTRQIDMYDRARADARPASIAYPVDVDIDARDLAKSLMRSTMSGTAMFTPDKAIPQLMPCWGGGHGQKKVRGPPGPFSVPSPARRRHLTYRPPHPIPPARRRRSSCAVWPKTTTRSTAWARGRCAGGHSTPSRA